MMERAVYIEQIEKAFLSHPIVAILGPRQCGKTTLAHLYIEHERLNGSVHFFDLENSVDLMTLENPKTALESLDGLIVLDEIQRAPDLFTVLRVLADQKRPGRRFLILGSASRELIRQSSESLAGRIAYIELPPFSLFEVESPEKLWLRGGFPNSYLADSNDDSLFWREQYITTFLEKDIPNLGIRIAPQALRRFWMMLTHYHGQAFNTSEIGKSLGAADTTIRHYLDRFMVRQLLPWYENIKKRQIKTPKIYFRDSGIFHVLIGITDKKSLLHHPKLGASWEGFALEEVIRSYQAIPQECYFWGIHEQAELDLLLIKRGKRMGFDFKFRDAPKLTKSMKIAVQTLNLDSLEVIYPGEKDYQLDEKIKAKALVPDLRRGGWF